ncbi:MAG: nicotinate-nucleotide adenylyltransferase, partial [Nitrospirae bacterium]|nr:nicotinate-nucleotide adenylyltransferase [Nitrospirota bacterium]
LSLTNFIVLSRPGKNFSDLFQSPYLDMKKTLLAGIDNGDSESCTTVLQSGKQVILARVTQLGISSTDIRKRVKKGTSLKYLLPAEVESYIISNNLYKKRIEQKRVRGRRECL